MEEACKEGGSNQSWDWDGRGRLPGEPEKGLDERMEIRGIHRAPLVPLSRLPEGSLAARMLGVWLGLDLKDCWREGLPRGTSS